MVGTSSTGIGLCLAVVLLSASVGKLRAPREFELALVKLLPLGLWHVPGLDSRRSARLIIAIEMALALAIALRLAPLPVAGATAALFGVFTIVSFGAARQKLQCGCFSQGNVASWHTLFRTATLFAAAVTYVVLVVNEGHQYPPAAIDVGSVAIAAALATLAWLPVATVNGLRVFHELSTGRREQGQASQGLGFLA